MKKWMWVGLGALVIALVGAAGYYGYLSSRPPAQTAEEEAPATVEVTTGDVQQAVSAPGQMIETKRESLRMGVEGQLEEVLVRPGDVVTEGQVLARMADKEAFEARAASAHLEVLQARQELDDLTASAPKAAADAQLALLEAEKKLEKAKNTSEAMKYPRAGQERLDSTYADYQKALEDVAMAQNNFDNVVTLPENDPRRVSAVMQLTSAQTRRDQTLGIYNWLSGKPTQADIDKAAADLKQAQAETDLARRALERVKGGPDSTQFDLANAKIADLEAKYQQALADLEHLELKAPFAGVIVEVSAKAGDPVTAGGAVMVLTDPNALEAEVTVVEEDWPLIKAGQEALLYLDASTSDGLTGRVGRVVPARSSGERPVYPVYITPASLPEGIAPGMTVDASIVIEARKDVLVLPKAVVRARGDGTAQVEVWEGGKRVKREIKIGLSGDQMVEILEGLVEGDQVVGQ